MTRQQKLAWLIKRVQFTGSRVVPVSNDRAENIAREAYLAACTNLADYVRVNADKITIRSGR